MSGNKKEFASAFVLNMLSFFIYIVAQQILFMPLMGRWLSEDMFANFVIYIAIFSIASNALGNELGIVNQIDENSMQPNYKRILAIIASISSVIVFVILLFLRFSFFDSFLLSLTVFFANYRLYTGGYLRKIKLFKKVLLQNVLYFLGMAIGLFLYTKTNFIWLPSLLAEMISLPYSIVNSDLLKKTRKQPSASQLKRFFSFSFVSFQNNLLTYLDKILIYPILGPVAVDAYYSTTTVSKIANMVVNPLHGVLLTWIKKSQKNKITNLFIRASIPISIIVFLVCLPLTYVALNILYPQFFNDGKTIILPVSLAVGISIGSAILKSLLMKFVGNKMIVKIYSIYFLIFIILAIFFSKIGGLVGFSYSIVISRMILYISFVITLRKIGREENN